MLLINMTDAELSKLFGGPVTSINPDHVEGPTNLENLDETVKLVNKEEVMSPVNPELIVAFAEMQKNPSRFKFLGQVYKIFDLLGVEDFKDGEFPSLYAKAISIINSGGLGTKVSISYQSTEEKTLGSIVFSNFSGETVALSVYDFYDSDRIAKAKPRIDFTRFSPDYTFQTLKPDEFASEYEGLAQFITSAKNDPNAQIYVKDVKSPY